MSRFVLMFAAVIMAFSFPAMAETRIGVVDLRQALFSSDDAKTFSESLQKDFAGDEARVREAQEAARKLQERLEKDGAMFNFLKQRLDSTVNQRKQAFLEQARPEVDAAVKELLEENNLDLILPSEAVVYVKPEMNLTSQLLEKLNR